MSGIPKRISFFWEGSTLSWLRYMTLHTFRLLNPDWDMYLYVSPDKAMEHKKWPGNPQDCFEYVGEDYFDRVYDLGINIEKWVVPDRLIRAQASPTHKSDLFQWWILWKEGGLYADMDIIWTRPIDEWFSTYGNYDVISCCLDGEVTRRNKSPKGIFCIGFIGGKPGTPFYKDTYEAAINNFKANQYQSSGAVCFYVRNLCSAYDFMRKYPKLTFHNLNFSVVYPFSWCNDAARFIDCYKELPEDCIGIHWFGGTVPSQRFNNQLNEETLRDYDNTVCYHLRKVLIENCPDYRKKVSKLVTEDIKCSIVIATRDKAAYLRNTLRSIFRQQPGFNFEVIIVDDGSTDNTRAVCGEFPVKYYYLKNNVYRNPAKARNVGYRAAKGDIIIAQSDEVIHVKSDTIENLCNRLHEGEFHLASVYNIKDGKMHDTYVSVKFPKKIFQLGALWRKDLYAIGGNDEEFVAPAYEDDWFTWCLVRGLGLKAVIHDDIVGHHQDHPRPKDLNTIVVPSRKLLFEKLDEGVYCASGGPWLYETVCTDTHSTQPSR